MSGQSASLATDLVAPPRAVPGLQRAAIALVAVGGLLCLIALLAGEAARVRFAFAYVWGFAFVWSVVLGSLFFVALQHVTRTVWSVVLRRSAEMWAAPMWLVAVFFVGVLMFSYMPGAFRVFPWADASIVAHDSLLEGKRAYLNLPFFTARGALFFAVWIAFATYFVGTSLKQDRGEGDPVAASAGMRKAAVPFMLIFALTATFAGIDWLMSLEPHWFSTIFGVYVFSGMVVAALAAITISTVLLRESGRLGAGVVTDEHLYSLGALLFVFVCFWAYIAFSQYMLIWYANVPEEAGYLRDRLHGGWLGVSVTLAIVRFGIPFVMLLSRRAKMNARILLWVSVLMLAGQLLDLYWLIMPEYHEEGPALGWQELGPPLLMIGAMMLYVSRFLGRYAPMAVGDPLLDESRQFRL